MDSNLTDFPFVVWFDTDSDIGGRAHATGQNIRFTVDPHGDANLLYYDRIYFNVATGNATGRFKVKIASILASGGATIRIWYDNSAAADGEDEGNTYDASYRGVYHMGEASGYPADSSGNSRDFDGSNGTAAYQQTGAIYHGIEYDSDEYHTQTNGITNLCQPDGAVEFWYDETGTAAGYERFFEDDNNEATGLYLFYRNGGDQNLTFWYGGSDQYNWPTTTANLFDGSLHYCIVTYEDTGANVELTLYIDNTSEGADTEANTYDFTTADLVVANRTSDAARPVLGILSEMIFHGSIRSAAWWKFAYENINQTDDYEQTWGAEVGVGGYTLTCDAGSYALTGTAMTPLHAKLLGIGAGSYAIAGTAMSPLHDKTLGCATGSFTITGVAMSPLHNKVISLGSGSFVITGTAVTPLHDKTISLEAGSYVITGQDITLVYSGGVIKIYGSGLHLFQPMFLD